MRDTPLDRRYVIIQSLGKGTGGRSSALAEYEKHVARCCAVSTTGWAFAKTVNLHDLWLLFSEAITALTLGSVRKAQRDWDCYKGWLLACASGGILSNRRVVEGMLCDSGEARMLEKHMCMEQLPEESPPSCRALTA